MLVVDRRAARAQDAAELLVRTNRLEGQVRQLSGQIEQFQFQNRELEDQLQKFQQDVEYRFQELKGAAARPIPARRPQRPRRGAPATLPPAPQPAPQKRSDVFDPAAQPAAPGAPRTLGDLPAILPRPRSAFLRVFPVRSSIAGLSRPAPRRDG